eukprot:jgi/Psemu1/57508/gm1.57508_g
MQQQQQQQQQQQEQQQQTKQNKTKHRLEFLAHRQQNNNLSSSLPYYLKA